MPARRNSSKYLTLLFVLTFWSSTLAQTTPPPAKPQDDVVRVYTELVQTDVMVFDKQGKFVNGLTADNFELRIDGKPRAIQSFEQITAGSNEESQLAAARGATTLNLKRPVPLDRGRIVFFYIDDLHMDLAGIHAAKKIITLVYRKRNGPKRSGRDRVRQRTDRISATTDKRSHGAAASFGSPQNEDTIPRAMALALP